jgi:uncharacterized BrkB/YihY/UPF0761 family membrane protein
MASPWLQKFSLLGTFAGALAFYFLLALVPLFILATTLVHHALHLDITPQLRDLLAALLPSSLDRTPGRVVEAVIAGTSRGWFTFGFIGILWACISFMNELARAIHLIFADQLDASAGGWRRWFKSIALIALWCGALATACILFIASTRIPELAHQWPWLQGAALLAAQVARWTTTFALLGSAATLTYRLVPARPASWAVCAGVGFGVALAWMGMGTALTRGLPLLWSQSPLPLAFGSFLIVMIWAYACCWALLLGAWLAARRSGSKFL